MYFNLTLIEVIDYRLYAPQIDVLILEVLTQHTFVYQFIRLCFQYLWLQTLSPPP